MAGRHEASELLKSGGWPAAIAEAMGIGTERVIQHLYTQVGEGAIRRSDILFSIPKELRGIFEQVIGSLGGNRTASEYAREIEKTVKHAAREGGVDSDEKFGETLRIICDRPTIEMYLELRDARVSEGDMYEFVCEIETTLHDKIKEVLVKHYGEDEWWSKGVPQPTREECAKRREQDEPAAGERFEYTTLIDLRKIMDKQWAAFGEALPKNLAGDKKRLLRRLDELNEIRNRVMHPVKRLPFTEEHFAAVRSLREDISADNWRCSE